MTTPEPILTLAPAATYFDELTRAMTLLAEDERTVFVGQAVKYPGQAAFKTFEGVPMEKRIEMPVCEDFQAGFCIGLALEGYIPVSFYPRWDFLLMAAGQIVNHLDKMPVMTGFRPKVIFRTAVGRTSPFDPGPQHTQNHTFAFRQMLTTMDVHELFAPHYIVPTYEKALKSERSSIIVERMSKY